MILTGSVWRKVLVSVIAAVGFVLLHEVTIPDSQSLPWLMPAVAESTAQPPAPGVRLPFGATAYCKGMVTAAGVAAQTGVAAADPSLLPLGSIVQIDAPETRYDGIYSILDTGPAVQGRLIDIYMWSCHEALRFGRRPVHLTVLRLGWKPHAITQTFMDRLFRRPEVRSEPAPIPSRPVPIVPPDGQS